MQSEAINIAKLCPLRLGPSTNTPLVILLSLFVRHYNTCNVFSCLPFVRYYFEHS